MTKTFSYCRAFTTRSNGALLALSMLLVGALALTLSAAAPAGSGVKRVKVRDDYYSPAKLTVKKGTTVKFKWGKSNRNPHNVTLRNGPRKVGKKKFTSSTGTTGVKFNRSFRKPGIYKFYCTIHPGTMNLKLTVKRP